MTPFHLIVLVGNWGDPGLICSWVVSPVQYRDTAPYSLARRTKIPTGCWSLRQTGPAATWSAPERA